MLDLLVFAQDAGPDAVGGAAAAAGSLCFFVFYLLILVLVVAGMWKLFDKAGEPGWAAIIPIYNAFVLTKISGKEILWFVLLLLPCINLVAFAVISLALAERFGKSPAFGIGIFLLPFIFLPILGFSSARYQ